VSRNNFLLIRNTKPTPCELGGVIMNFDPNSRILNFLMHFWMHSFIIKGSQVQPLLGPQDICKGF